MIELKPELNFVETEFLNAYYDWTSGIEGADQQLKPQVEIGPYRVDFLYLDRYVIEIDGRYHETETQRTADYVRERYLVRNGYKVIRFTGTEVKRNARSCITELMETVYSKANVWQDHNNRLEVG